MGDSASFRGMVTAIKTDDRTGDVKITIVPYEVDRIKVRDVWPLYQKGVEVALVKLPESE